MYISDKKSELPLPTDIEEVFSEVEEYTTQDYDEEIFCRILKVIDKYHARERVYISGAKDVLRTALRLAPDIVFATALKAI